MRAYLAVTGILFLLLAGAHALRVVDERHLARDPWFLGTTVTALALAIWALRLFARSRRS